MINEVSGGARDNRVRWLMSQLIASVSNFIFFTRWRIKEKNSFSIEDLSPSVDRA